MDIQQLNDIYAIKDKIEFVEGDGDFIYANISNNKASAIVSLYGAHLLSYIPVKQKDILWLSPATSFEHGKPIRGGIPICFPWFGPHPDDIQKPMHGFARLSNWDVKKTSVLPNEDIELILSLVSNAYTMALWPYSFKAEIKIVIGLKLWLTLTYTNTGNESFICSDALHTYFNISDTANIGISGLKGHRYYAGFAKEANNKQFEETLLIKQEENRRYINHTNDCILADNVWNRKIRVAKHGSKVTVVWNPWIETTKTMADIPDNGYNAFVCIEAANYYDDSRTIKPGESHSISTTIEIGK